MMEKTYKAKRLRYFAISWFASLAGIFAHCFIIDNYTSLWGAIVGISIGLIIASIILPIHNLNITILEAGVQGPSSRWLWKGRLFAAHEEIDLTRSKNTIWRSFVALKSGHNIAINPAVLGRTATQDIFNRIEAKLANNRLNPTEGS